MGLFDSVFQRGSNDRTATSLDQLVAEVPGPIEGRALVQFRSEEAPDQELWGLLLLTPDALHVVYGEGAGWVFRCR